MKQFYFFIIFLLIGNGLLAQKKELPKPNFANIQYGTHERNVLDIWFADTTKSTPLAIYIHGGGFVSGRKEKINIQLLQNLLRSGISVATINYRFLSHAPLPAAHHDALRALQFIRSKAAEWKIDKTKIGAFGGSAGAQLCMWLAFSDEMANPNSKDPIERESSRLTCVATSGGQTTMDSVLWQEWIPGFEKYHTTQEEFYGDLTSEELKETVAAISAISIITADDPPIFMSYYMNPDDPIPSKKAQGWKIHHVNFGIKLKEKMDTLGVEADLEYPTANKNYTSRLEFLKAKLL